MLVISWKNCQKYFVMECKHALLQINTYWILMFLVKLSKLKKTVKTVPTVYQNCKSHLQLFLRREDKRNEGRERENLVKCLKWDCSCIMTDAPHWDADSEDKAYNPRTRLMSWRGLQACGSGNDPWRREYMCENTGEFNSVRGALCLEVWNHVWVLQILKVKGASLSRGRCSCSALLWHPCEVCEQRLNSFTSWKAQQSDNNNKTKEYTSKIYIKLPAV